MPVLQEKLPRHLVWETALTELIFLFYFKKKKTPPVVSDGVTNKKRAGGPYCTRSCTSEIKIH